MASAKKAGQEARRVSPNATAKMKQTKPKPAPQGASTMERIAKGGEKVMSVSERARRGRKFPKDW